MKHIWSNLKKVSLKTGSVLMGISRRSSPAHPGLQHETVGQPDSMLHNDSLVILYTEVQLIYISLFIYPRYLVLRYYDRNFEYVECPVQK